MSDLDGDETVVVNRDALSQLRLFSGHRMHEYGTPAVLLSYCVAGEALDVDDPAGGIDIEYLLDEWTAAGWCIDSDMEARLREYAEDNQ